MNDYELSKLQALCDAAPVIDNYGQFDCTDDCYEFYAAARTAVPELIAKYRAMKVSNGINADAATKYCDEAVKLRAENESLKSEMARLVLATGGT